MQQVAERVAFPFTFLFKCEDGIWTSLACEVDVASCGDTLDQARDALKEAVELYVVDMLERGRLDDISRPVPPDALVELAGDHPEDLKVEYLTMILHIRQEPSPSAADVEFVRSMVAPVNCTRVATH